MQSNYPKQRYRVLVSVEVDRDADATVPNTQSAVAYAVGKYMEGVLTPNSTHGGYAFITGSIDIIGCEPVPGGPEKGA